jgi:uncharacterized repeat protein (TIGR01451 family)
MAQHGGSGSRRSGARWVSLLDAGARPSPASARRRLAIATVLGALALTLLAGGAHSAPGDVTIASTSAAGVKGTGPSSAPSVSADGTVVAFVSSATNLGPPDPDTLLDVYVKNIETGVVTLASTSDDGTKANGQSLNPHLSADGNAVAFEGYASNLDPADTDGEPDIYVKNLVTGGLTLASTSDAGAKGTGISLDPELSGDGTKVAFTTASPLDPADTTSLNDVYVKNVVTGDVVLASTLGFANAAFAAISADGTTVAFTWGADVYVRNLVTGDVNLVSTTAEGTRANGNSVGASLSADGTKVAFASRATNLHPADDDNTQDLYVKDLTTGALTLASVSDAGAKANGENAGVGGFGASLSGDGTRVAFMSMATNLDPSDADVLQDVYVKDLGTGGLVLASTSATGQKGDIDSFSPALTSDGAKVVFSTRSTNLHPADNDPFPRSDVFLKEPAFGPAPTGADLALFLTDSPDPVRPGDELTYAIDVVNNGPDEAESVEVSADLPAGVPLVSATPSAGGVCETTGDPIVCRWPTLDARDSVSVDIVVTTPGDPTTLTSAASVTSATPDRAPANNSDSATTQVRVPVADLRLFSADVPDPVLAGGELTYHLGFFNAGPDAASVKLSIDLPAGVTLVRATPDSGTCDTTGDPVVCRWPTVTTSGFINVAVVVTAPSTAGDITATVALASNADDPDLTNNEATLTTSVVLVLPNDEPQAGDDVITVVEDGSVTFDPRTNDTPGPPDESGQTLMLIFIFAPENGTATITPDGHVEYVPDPDHFGADRFAYVVCDDAPDRRCDSAFVDVTITPVNDAPVAEDDSITVPESGSLTFDPLGNDSPGPANEADQTLAAAITDAPANGTAVAADDGILYTPTPGFDGADGFTYRVCDDGTTAGAPDPRCDEATVTVDIESFQEQLEGIIDTSPSAAADKLEDALEKIEKAEQKLARTPPDRQGALGEYEGAVGEIAAAANKGFLPGDVGRSLMDRICASARKLADDAISEAEARAGDASKIAQARRARDEGDARRAAGRFKDAVSRYKDAVSKAEGA